MILNHKRIANVIVVILLGVFSFVVYVFFNSKPVSSQNEDREDLFEKQIMEIVLKTNILYEGSKLNDIVVLDKEGRDFTLKSILDTTPSLFLYVPQEGCGVCVEQVYDILKEYIKLGNDEIKVYLLVKSPNFRSFIANQDGEENKIKPLYIKEGWLGLDIEQLDTPFLFITDKNLIADHFFLIDKNIEHINRFYIEIVVRNFSK